MSHMRQIARDWAPPIVVRAALRMRSRSGLGPSPLHLSNLNVDIRSDDEGALRHLYNEYFVRQTMRFQTARPHPLIIDCGAHVGVSVLYWKSLYPEARVVAFEPDPKNFGFLQSNCSGVAGIELHNAAVWRSNGNAAFAAVGSDGGHMSELSDRQDEVERITVQSVRLRDYLKEEVELLKLDIEGAEVEVLRDCADRLTNVMNIFVEYHSFVDRHQQLAELCSILENGGFRLHAHSEMPAKQPFIERPVVNRKDFRLNIFGVRDEQPS